jgi:hypothetical protein
MGQPTRNKGKPNPGWFKPGHGGFPRRHPTIRQQRKAQAATLALMLADMDQRVPAGDTTVNPATYATVLNALRRTQAEL